MGGQRSRLTASTNRRSLRHPESRPCIANPTIYLPTFSRVAASMRCSSRQAGNFSGTSAWPRKGNRSPIMASDERGRAPPHGRPVKRRAVADQMLSRARPGRLGPRPRHADQRQTTKQIAEARGKAGPTWPRYYARRLGECLHAMARVYGFWRGKGTRAVSHVASATPDHHERDGRHEGQRFEIRHPPHRAIRSLRGNQIALIAQRPVISADRPDQTFELGLLLPCVPAT